MKVTLKSMGYLRNFLGQQPEEVELPENSSLQDLLHWIEEHHASQLPAYLWDFGQHKFRGPVVLVVNQKIAVDPNACLTEGQEVSVMYAVAGG